MPKTAMARKTAFAAGRHENTTLFMKPHSLIHVQQDRGSETMAPDRDSGILWALAKTVSADGATVLANPAIAPN
jgi:hypothetical protein